MISLLAGRESARRSEPPPSRHDLSKKKCTLMITFPSLVFRNFVLPPWDLKATKRQRRGSRIRSCRSEVRPQQGRHVRSRADARSCAPRGRMGVCKSAPFYVMFARAAPLTGFGNLLLVLETACTCFKDALQCAASSRC